jgi:acyl dehydratase
MIMGFDTGAGFEEIREGDRLPEYSVRMDRNTYFEYNRLINNINPLHSDQDYARRLGFKDIVVAGVYTFSFIPKMIEGWLEGPFMIRGIEIRYRNPIYIGETIVQKAHVRKKVSEGKKKYIECKFVVEDEGGNELTCASVTVDFS